MKCHSSREAFPIGTGMLQFFVNSKKLDLILIWMKNLILLSTIMGLGKCIWNIMQKELERLKMDIKASKKAVYGWVAAILILIALLLVISGCGANNSTDDTTEAISLNQVGEYSGAPYVYLNNNIPYFTDEEKENTKPFENYSSLDDLGRCGVAFANIYKDRMPTEERGPIGQIKPSGWHTVKYNGIIDGNYLYNRCHLIGYQLTGENANELNLITGTRYLNTEGMEGFENTVGDYVAETENHVLYRVTPLFEGADLVAKGVEIEAWSVEDKGAGICFNVFCYNVQPGIEIDYATGESRIADSTSKQASLFASDSEPGREETNNDAQTEEVRTYILNVNTKKFHLPTCSSVDRMSDKNKREVESTINEIKAQGYTPCSRCLGR